MLPRSDVLGLEDEATVYGIHAVYVAWSLRRKPLQHRAEWAGDFFDAEEGYKIRVAFLFSIGLSRLSFQGEQRVNDVSPDCLFDTLLAHYL